MIFKNVAKYRLAAVFLFSFPLMICAQKLYTLQDVLSIASQNSEDLQIINSAHTAGIEEINSFKASVYPQVFFTTGGAWYSNSLSSMGIFSNLLGGSGGGAGGGASGGLPFDRYSGMEYTMAATLSQPIFTFGRLGVVRKMANSQATLLDKQKILQREQFFLGVVMMYNMTVFAVVEEDVAGKSLEMSQKFHTSVDIDFKAGARSRIDWLQAQALLAQADARLKLAQAQKEVLLNRLKNITGMEEHADLQIDVGDNMYSPSLYIQSNSSSHAVPRSTQMKEIDLTLAQDLSRYEKSGLYPSINLNGQVANQLTIVYDPSGMEGSLGPVDLANPEYFNYKIGLSLNWALFDGFRTLSSHRKAWAYAKLEERNLSKLKKENKILLTEAEKLVNAGAESVKAAHAAREASALVYDQARADLEGGAISISQFMDIEKQFKESTLLYYRARAEELTAHINLKISRGQDVFE